MSLIILVRNELTGIEYVGSCRARDQSWYLERCFGEAEGSLNSTKRYQYEQRQEEESEEC